MMTVSSDRQLAAMDPGDVVDYAIDFRRLLPEGDLLTGATWTLPAQAVIDGLEVASSAIDETAAVVWLQVAGGSQGDEGWAGAGRSYGIACTATTAGGRALERTMQITVRER